MSEDNECFGSSLRVWWWKRMQREAREPADTAVKESTSRSEQMIQLPSDRGQQTATRLSQFDRHVLKFATEQRVYAKV